MTLFDQDGNVVWNGQADSLGNANFNVTFTDLNYTDTLRLEAVKNGESITQSISLLSNTPVILPMLRHDIAITGITPYRTIVSDRTMTSVNVTVANQGSVQETFTLIVSYNSTAFASQMITVGNGSTVKWLLIWNTTGVNLGNHTVTASVGQLPTETDTADNSLSCIIQVSILGDINGDGRVDMKDVSKVAAGFQTHFGDVKWTINGDLDENGVIDMKDISTTAKHFGEHYP